MTAQPQSLKGLDLLSEIARLKKERNAVILAHYYQKPEIQDLADFVGDSLDLSRKAAATDAEVIAFCGVRFMAETAKILSPEKIVVLPDMDAGCSLEDSCPPDQFKAFREAHPGPYRADLHQLLGGGESAVSDIIVTSISADIILKQIPKDQKIIFGPDRHLGGYLARKTGRDMLLWPGVCIVHQAFSRNRAAEAQGRASRRPGRGASRMPAAHHRPCRPCRVDQVDPRFRDARARPQTILVATEPHIIHQMEKAAPDKTFIGVPGGDGNCNCNMCPYMALNTLEKLYVALRDLQPRIELSTRYGSRRACRSSGCWKWPAARSGRAMSEGRSSITRRHRPGDQRGLRGHAGRLSKRALTGRGERLCCASSSRTDLLLCADPCIFVCCARQRGHRPGRGGSLSLARGYPGRARARAGQAVEYGDRGAAEGGARI